MLNSAQLMIMCWSDNIFTFSRSTTRAVDMMADVEAALWQAHRLQIKPSSREVIRAACAIYPAMAIRDSTGNTWQLKPRCRILGPTVCCTGSPTLDLDEAMGRIQRSFFRNSRLLLNSRVSSETRVRKLDEAALGIIRARAAAWSPSHYVCETLDRHQSRMLSWIARIRQQPHETGRQFGMRRARAVRGMKTCQWSRVYAETLLKWVSHVQRHPNGMPYQAIHCQDHAWVIEQRDRRSSVGWSTRTGTRAARGRVFRFDQAGWLGQHDPHGTRDPTKLRELSANLLVFLGTSVL